MALLFRALSKAYHQPLTASIDMLVVLISPTLEALTLFAFIVNRSVILLRKLEYVMVSVATAQSNTKQRFANQEIVFAI